MYIDSIDNLADLFVNLKKWAKDYRKELMIFEKDLKLKLNLNMKIFIAIDFYDLVSQAFPERNLILKSNKELEIRRAIARESILSNSNQIYSYPLILLPPYLSEANDFFYVAGNNLVSLNSEELKGKIQNQIKSILTKLENKETNHLLDELEKHSLSLAIYYSPQFMIGLRGLKDLLRCKVNPDPTIIGNYFQYVLYIKDMNNKYYSSLKRYRPNKTIPNLRDSKAIQYIEELNKRLDEKEMLIFVSSSNIFNLFRDDHRISRRINDDNYDLIRGIDSFYYALLETYMVFRKEDINGKILDSIFKLDHDQIEMLLNYVTYHVDLLGHIESITELYINSVGMGSISGRFRAVLIDFINELSTLKEIMDKKEKDIILDYIRYNFNDNDILHLDKYLDDVILKSLVQLRDDILSPKFTDLLQERILELNKEQEDHELWINEFAKKIK
jgi:hypothetical protein